MKRQNNFAFSWMLVETSLIPPPFTAMAIRREFSVGF
jgi:hypothetical protein